MTRPAAASRLRMRASGLALAAGLAASVSGCATVGPDFRPPAPVSAAAGYGMAGETLPPGVTLDPAARTAGPWWTALGSPALDEVERLAMAGSPGVAEARAALERYQAAQDEVTGQRGVQAELTPSVQRQKFNPAAFGFGGGSSVPSTSPFASFGTARTFSVFSLGGRVSYDLDLFGGGRRRVEAARVRVEQAGHEADAAYLSLSSAVAMQAIRIAGLRGELSALEEIVTDDRTLLDLAYKSLSIGGIPKITVVQIEAQLAEDEALLPPLRRQLDTARHQLALLVGKAPADWSPPDFQLSDFKPPAQTPVSLPSALAARRPDILAAQAELHAATAAIGVAKADQYPDIRLSANGAFQALTPQDVISSNSTGWTLLTGLTAPVFDGGARKAHTRAAEADARRALARYRLTVLRAFTEVSDALAALQSDSRRVETLGRGVKFSGEAADITLDAARLGARTAGDVVSSRRQLDRDRRELAQAQAQRLSDYVTLFAATAADWRVEPAKTAGAAPASPAGR